MPCGPSAFPPPPSPTPRSGRQQARGAWASFKRAETANGPLLSLTSPPGEFGGKWNTAGLSITGQEGQRPAWRLWFESQLSHCPSRTATSSQEALGVGQLKCSPVGGGEGCVRKRTWATKVCSLRANSCYYGASGLVEDSVKSLTGAQHPAGAQFMLNPLPKP